MADIEERFAVYVRDRGEHHLRAAALLTGDWHAAEDLMQASLVKLHRAWPKLRLDSDPDAYPAADMREVDGYMYLNLLPGTNWDRVPAAAFDRPWPPNLNGYATGATPPPPRP